jgi:hypothetical protein
VAHSFSAHLGLDYFDPTFFTDDSSVLHAFVFSAVTLVVFSGPEYLGTEKAVPFGLKGAIINGFRFLDLSVRPLSDFLRRGKRYTYCIET